MDEKTWSNRGGLEVTLKTLEDLEGTDWDSSEGMGDEATWLKKSIIKAEAVKWVKEDRASIKADKKMPKSTRMLMNYLNTKWMKRLGITEEDLK